MTRDDIAPILKKLDDIGRSVYTIDEIEEILDKAIAERESKVIPMTWLNKEGEVNEDCA